MMPVESDETHQLSRSIVAIADRGWQQCGAYKPIARVMACPQKSTVAASARPIRRAGSTSWGVG